MAIAALATAARAAAPIKAPPASPLQPFTVRGRRVLVKRDDRYASLSGVAGNKARKLYGLYKRCFGRQRGGFAKAAVERHPIAALWFDFRFILCASRCRGGSPNRCS